jgi:hypothetical protein
MPITIVEDINHNNRLYNIGRLELTNSDLSGDVDKHPLGKLLLKYIASPFTTNDYNDVEDNLLYFLNPTFVETLSESDSEVMFDKKEYLKHLTFIKDKFFNLTVESLLRIIANDYAGSQKREVNMALSETGLTDKGKLVLLKDINTELGTDHVLSAHIKGLKSKKIVQAADKNVKYTPALERVTLQNLLVEDEELINEEFITVNVVNSGKTKIELPTSNKKVSFSEHSVSIEIDFLKLFNILFEEVGIKPQNTTLNKAAKPIKEYELPTGDTFSAIEETIIRKLNIKREWNNLAEDYRDDYNDMLDEAEHDDLDAQEIIRQKVQDLKTGQDKELGNFAETLYSEKLWTKAKLDSFLYDDKDLIEFKFSIPNKEEALIFKKIINWKADNKIDLVSFEEEIQSKFARKTRRAITIDADRRTSVILHAPDTSLKHTDKKMFKFNAESEIISETNMPSIDLHNAMSNSREIKEMVERHALIPRKVGIMTIMLRVIFADDSEIQDRQRIAESDEDKDVKDNAKYLLNSVYNVYRLDKVMFKTSKDFTDDFTDWTERSPERFTGANQKKIKIGRPNVKSEDKTSTISANEGRTEMGGQPTNVQVKTNTLIYYIKRQIASLQRVLNG